MKKFYIIVVIFLLLPLIFLDNFVNAYYNSIGRKRVEEGRYKEAIEAFKKSKDKRDLWNHSLSLYKEGEEPLDLNLAENFFNRGNYFYEKEEYERANEEYWQAMLLSDSLIMKTAYELNYSKLEDKKKKNEINFEGKGDKTYRKDDNGEENIEKSENREENSMRNEKINPKDKIKEEDNLVEEKKDPGENIIAKEEYEVEEKENEKVSNKKGSNKEKSQEGNETSLEEAKVFLEGLNNMEKGDLKNNHRILREGQGDNDGKQW